MGKSKALWFCWHTDYSAKNAQAKSWYDICQHMKNVHALLDEKQSWN